jgi:peptide/nickel transport system substrate-binding protein
LRFTKASGVTPGGTSFGSLHRVGNAFLVAALVVIVACTSSPVGSSQTPAGRGNALKIALTNPTFSGLDPQGAWNSHEWELMRCCLLRTLMTYPGVPGYRGTQPLPDLAVTAPALSADGKTWTFKLKEGIHYAPPLEEVEITANDLVRALLRVGGEQVLVDGQPFGPGLDYLRVIEGFSEYAQGTSDSIAGVSTPDKYTLRIRTIRPDASLVHLFAMAFTAPIPPLPENPETPFGAATGHRLDTDFDPPLPRGPRADGYGPFLIASGPYMLEGAPALEPSQPADRQAPSTGFAPAWWTGEDFRGRITLVRNPSWDPSTDMNRAALPDRIEISVAPSNASLYRKLRRGDVDAIMSEAPPTEVVETYRSDPSLRGRVSTAALSGTFFASINVAEPPLTIRTSAGRSRSSSIEMRSPT